MKVSERFLNGVKDYDQKLQNDEWFFAKLCQEIVESTPSHEAYEAMSPTLQEAISQKDQWLCIEAIQLSLALARKADTTETPKTLHQQLTELREKVANFGENADYANERIDDIVKWFRAKGI